MHCQPTTDHMPAVIIAHHTCIARCPSCEHHSRFTYNGEQRWPAHVAKAVGLPEVQTLWSCGHCHTTVSDVDLRG